MSTNEYDIELQVPNNIIRQKVYITLTENKSIRYSLDGERWNDLCYVIPKWNYCIKCAHPLPSNEECHAHDEKREILTRTIAVGLYFRTGTPRRNILTDLILSLKSSINPAIVLGASMSFILEKRLYGVDYKNFDLITYVPLHENEMKQDSDLEIKYNQAELLAHVISQILKLKVIPLFIKKMPASLRWRSVEERWEIARRVYSLNPQIDTKILKNKSILIVDDIRTTGATGNTLAQLLIKHGAREVTLLVAGRTFYYNIYRHLLDKLYKS